MTEHVPMYHPETGGHARIPAAGVARAQSNGWQSADESTAGEPTDAVGITPASTSTSDAASQTPVAAPASAVTGARRSTAAPSTSKEA